MVVVNWLLELLLLLLLELLLLWKGLLLLCKFMLNSPWTKDAINCTVPKGTTDPKHRTLGNITHDGRAEARALLHHRLVHHWLLHHRLLHHWLLLLLLREGMVAVTKILAIRSLLALQLALIGWRLTSHCGLRSMWNGLWRRTSGCWRTSAK